jgi:hypothetical protein
MQCACIPIKGYLSYLDITQTCDKCTGKTSKTKEIVYRQVVTDDVVTVTSCFTKSDKYLTYVSRVATALAAVAAADVAAAIAETTAVVCTYLQHEVIRRITNDAYVGVRT